MNRRGTIIYRNLIIGSASPHVRVCESTALHTQATAGKCEIHVQAVCYAKFYLIRN